MAKALMAELGVREDADPSKASGGEARRAALARALASDPDILLLDEPTNHLDLVAIEWLEARLQNAKAAFALITHDRRLLADLTNTSIWLDRGLTHRLDLGFAGFESWRDQKLEQEESERRKLDRKITAEEHWIRFGVTARRKRNMRRVDELAALRREKREARKAVGLVNMAAQEAQNSGALVIEAERVSKSFSGSPLIRDFSMRVKRGDRVGFIGPNGVGKTTLINLLTKQAEPDEGEVKLGSQLLITTLDQGRTQVPPTTTLADALTGGGSDYVTVNGANKHIIGYLKDFLFAPEQARTPIDRLSGGERGRLMLARALARLSNLLVLDEPTNDLDIETLDLLQELLSDYPGTVLLVSHDRDFIDKVVTSVVVAEGGGRWVEYAGGYSDMLAQRGGGFFVPPPAQQKKAAAKSADDERPKPKRKLSFSEQTALAMLPKRIEELQRQLAEIEKFLGDADAHDRDPQGFMQASRRHGDLQAELAAAEDEWLRLELLREEMESFRSSS